MNPAQKQLLTGALKSAIGAATGLILTLPVVDYEHFSPMTFGGWKHLGAAIFFTVLVGEARYWKQWADSGDGVPKQ